MSTRRVKANQEIDITSRPDTLPIQTGSQLYGYVHVEGFATEHCAMFIRYLMSPLILWFDKELVIRSAMQAEKDDFVWSLAKGSLSEPDELIKKGQLLGFTLTVPYSCIVGSIHADFHTTPEYAETWIASNIFSLREHIISLANSLHKRIMLSYQQEMLILFVESQAEGSETEANLFLDKLEEEFSFVFPHLAFSWGISDAKRKHLSNVTTDLGTI